MSGCRISKVRMKDGGAEVSILRTPKPDGSGTTGSFVETLVYVLGRARAGKVLGYAMVFHLENEKGVSTIESADVSGLDGDDTLMLLGGIRQMELNFLHRSALAVARN